MDYYPTIIPIPGFSEPFSCWTQLLATAFFFVANAYLIYRGRGNSLRVAALVLYAICVAFLFSMSGVYHLLQPGGVPRAVFQRLDHASIWSMIAGTFTPIHVILFRGFWRWGVLLAVWAAAITGLVLEVVFFSNFPEALSLTLYIGLGWVGLLSGMKFARHYREKSFWFLVLGGLAYSIGGVLEFFRWPVLIQGVIGPHEIFHLFVFLGAYFHWRFILVFSDVGVTQRLTFVVKVRPGDEFFASAKGESIAFKADSKPDLYAKLSEHVRRKYREYTRPKAVRLEFVQEEFVAPEEPVGRLVAPDCFS